MRLFLNLLWVYDVCFHLLGLNSSWLRLSAIVDLEGIPSGFGKFVILFPFDCSTYTMDILQLQTM